MKNRIINELINELIETRINGNSIKGNITYEAMLKRVTKEDIIGYSCESIGYLFLISGTKLNMIEQIKNQIIKG